MYYQNYEDYMRAVLGYANNERAYKYDSYYPSTEQNNQEVEKLYPDIYRIVNPVVEDVCKLHRSKPITEELVKMITDEVYGKVEKTATTQVNASVKTELKNGDVRNPNAKISEAQKLETRQMNFLLNDLIRILVLRKLLQLRLPMRPQLRPPFPEPRQQYGLREDMPLYGPQMPIL